MEKKEPLLKRLNSYADNLSILSQIGMFLSGISAVMAVIPIVFIWKGLSEVILMYPNFKVTMNFLQFVYIAVGLVLLSILIYTFALMCTHGVAFRIAKNMRLRALTHLMSLPLGYFSKTGSGKIRQVISDSAEQTENFVAHQIPDLVGAFVTPFAVLAVAFIIDWKLGLISLIPLVLAFIAMAITMGKDYAEKVKQYQTSMEKVNNEAVEYVRGIAVVKTFGQSIYSFKKFYNEIIQYKDFVMVYTMSMRFSMPTFQTLLGGAVVFLLVGGVLVIQTSRDVQTSFLNLLFYILLIPSYAYMMMKIMWVSQTSMLAEDAVSRVETLLQEKPLVESENPKEISRFDIAIENVSFKYPKANVNAITNISLNIEQGKTIAFVGESGCGKSTLVSLIARFWDVEDGSIKIGGIDVRDISEDGLMKNISFVFQNTNLYKMTILENVLEGRPEATRTEVLKALEVAQCFDIVEKLPNGVDTIVGTKGVYLSGGECQRIALARAILKDAPIILLDEATAFTDPENEHKIQLAMAELSKQKTVVMIAHRLSTVQNVDCIYVVKDGKIIESGSHAELVSKKGEYANMWEEYNRIVVWKDVKQGER